ncbi:MAG: sulfite reductase subunit A [Candidatus Zixiibacteriota bacterium]|nr:MAG: sulfite reductase subunit A [candidate division Zixibacteria bacterium]
MNNESKSVIERKDFQALFDALSAEGYKISGPTVRDNAVIYDEIGSAEELPIGWTDHQEGGSYRLTKSKKKTLFGFILGPYTWKKLLYPPEKKIWEAQKSDRSFEIVEAESKPIKQAFVGVRPCELKAIGIQDKILRDGQHSDPEYGALRRNLFIVAVNCTNPGNNCFCVSMNSGPGVSDGFDLALTEMFNGKDHYFVIEAGSRAGKKILEKIPHRPAKPEELEQAEKAVERAASKMGRSLDMKGLKEILHNNFDSHYWGEIAKRCLTCGNCTMVCPTCFCCNIEDTTNLGGDRAERRRYWDTCYSVDFSYIHGGSIRSTDYSRYRQWLMHKIAYWQDQFGTPGCVGCGRCITWCPVGIDITEEAGAIREKA